MKSVRVMPALLPLALGQIGQPSPPKKGSSKITLILAIVG